MRKYKQSKKNGHERWPRPDSNVGPAIAISTVVSTTDDGPKHDAKRYDAAIITTNDAGARTDADGPDDGWWNGNAATSNGRRLRLCRPTKSRQVKEV